MTTLGLSLHLDMDYYTYSTDAQLVASSQKWIEMNTGYPAKNGKKALTRKNVLSGNTMLSKQINISRYYIYIYIYINILYIIYYIILVQ